MRQNQSSRWMRFQAHQISRADACSFVWSARTGPFGLVTVKDQFLAGEGHLEAKLLGLVLARPVASTDLNRGEVMRYLAELPWVPDAICHNPDLQWTEIEPNKLQVAIDRDPLHAQVTLTLDHEGRIEHVFSPDRPRAIGSDFKPTPWRGRFFNYQYRGSRLIPSAAEVAWEIDGNDVVCWEGQIQDWQVRRV